MHRIIASLVALASVASADLSLPYKRFQLDNGLVVLVHEDHSLPLAAINLWFRVGSKDERPGRTGLAHLFEHLMFKGSKNIPDGEFDRLIEGAGGSNNATTSTDRTNYFMALPPEYLELALWIESDRMGWLLDAMTQEKLDNQREVVRNERRQRLENRPYGMAWKLIGENLYPPGHPYHWPVIGSHEDLAAASIGDVKNFFKRHYAPNQATLVVAGDVRSKDVFELAGRYFDEIPRGPDVEMPSVPPAALSEEKRLTHEDRVELPRLYMAWHSPPFYSAGDAELDVLSQVLAGAKSSRLYKRLVYEDRIAQDVSAFQSSSMLGSSFIISSTAKPGRTLDELGQAIGEELDRLRREPPSQREIERSLNQLEAALLRRLEHVDARADLLNQYRFYTGEPDYLKKDLARYRAITPESVHKALQTHLGKGRVVLRIVPKAEDEK